MSEQELGSRLIRTHDQRPRVFISSTLEELRSERQAAKQAIMDLRLSPIMFESGAHPYPPRAWYQANLEQSHIYVGIFGKSYGELVPGMDISGLEDEFNLAGDKPRLVYVHRSSKGRDPRLKRLLNRIREEGDIVYCPFSSSDDLVELVKEDVIHHLSEAYFLNAEPHPLGHTTFSYLGKLQEEMEGRGLVRRDHVLEAIQSKLKSHGVLHVVGEPGIGKTYLLGSLALELDAVYVPLRRKSTQQVCAYLASQLSGRRSRPPRRLLTEEEARAGLQEELENSSTLLLIDEVDQNQTTAEALLGMEFQGCPAVFASRDPQTQLLQEVATFEVPPFTDEEVDQFLEVNDILLPPGERESLRDASRGNPLYLFYSTQHELLPLPEGLAEYERVLWGQLSPPQKEIFNFVALSFAPVMVSNLHDLLGQVMGETGSPMDTSQLVDSAGSLLRNLEGHLEIFHPHFEEYVGAQLEAAGLSIRYHRILGEYAERKKWVISTAFHFVRADDPRAKPYLTQASSGAFMRGNWPLAEELLQNRIATAGDEDDIAAEAHARFALSSIYGEMGRFRDARQQLDRVLKLLSLPDLHEVDENEQFADAVRLWSSFLRVQEGAPDEAVEDLRSAAHAYRGRDPTMEAGIEVNLAYACLQVPRFREGAEAAQRALDIFTELDDQRGIYSSLLNLSACVGELGDDDLREQYARRLIDFGSSEALPRLEAAGLNHLAVVQRRNHDFDGAERSLKRAVEIAQRLGSLETEVMNIANLGNVYKDRHLLQRAEDAYREALAKAQEYQLLREEARGFELMARLKYETAVYPEAVSLGEQALELHKSFGNNLRIASTLDYLARSYAKIRRNREAANTYESSAHHYELADSWREATFMFQRAAGLWSFLRDPQRAFHCTAQGVRCAIASEDPDLAKRLLPRVASVRGDKLGQLYIEAQQPFLSGKSFRPFSGLMRTISTYCSGHSDPSERECLKLALTQILERLSPEGPRSFLNAAAAGIGDAGSLLSAENLDDLARSTADKMPHLHYRVSPDGLRIWTIGLEWRQPMISQVIQLSDDLLPQRIAMALALILRANPDLIEKTITEFGENREEGFSLYVVTQGDFPGQADIEVSSYAADGDSLPASVTASNVPWDQPQPPTVLMLHDEYEQESELTRHPDNKALLWVVMNVFRALVAHATHTSTEDHPVIAKRAREFCEAVLL